MRTQMHIFRVGQPIETQNVEFKDSEPPYDELRRIIEPLLEDEAMEHVMVLWKGKRADMFVAECGRLALTTREPLPRNEEATAIYRANWLSRYPHTEPESLTFIAGTAIVFEDRVWF